MVKVLVGTTSIVVILLLFIGAIGLKNTPPQLPAGIDKTNVIKISDVCYFVIQQKNDFQENVVDMNGKEISNESFGKLIGYWIISKNDRWYVAELPVPSASAQYAK
jgi:hypothetical protein